MDEVIRVTIEKLESVAVTPFKYLSPILGIIIKKNAPSADKSYLNTLQAQAKEYNVQTKVAECGNPQDVAQAIQWWRTNPNISGIIILSDFDQASRALYNMIPARLDIDGLSAYSLGKLCGNPSPIAYRHAPCAPVACLKILQTLFPQGMVGKKAAVIGRSIRVGRPLVEILNQQNATVTLYHSKSVYPENKFVDYDIIISAIGKGKFLDCSKVEPTNKVLIDVGTNVIDHKLYGDFDYDNMANKAKYITPVPGGVGNMTTAVLFAKLFANKYSLTEGENIWQ